MPAKPGAQNENSGLPLDTFAAIDWMDKKYKMRLPNKGEWSTPKGRLEYARYLGQRDLIEKLQGFRGNFIAKQKGG